MGKTAATDPAVAGVLKRPFAEQVAFFRGKLGNLVPTRKWTDVLRDQHDRAFMVAGAAKADLLSDFASAVDRAITEGKSIDAFRKDFDAIVEKNGWNYRGDRMWRTRVIYGTNMTTSYSAGRLAQLREGGFKYWIYKHSDSVLYPRPLHVSWDGLTLTANDPWWQKHYPPNGWGCKCRVIGADSEKNAARLGGKAADAPDDGLDPKTGAPAGIDKGWDYMPGGTVSDAVRIAAQQTQQWEYTLAKSFMQAVPERVRDDVAIVYRRLPSVADDVRRYAQRVIEKRTHLDIPPYRTIGLLTSKEAAQVKKKIGVDVSGFDFSLDASSVGHIQAKHGNSAEEPKRGQRAIGADDYGRLPALLSAPEKVTSAGMSDVGHPVVRYEKTIGGERFVAAFELRSGRRSMALISMWVGRP